MPPRHCPRTRNGHRGSQFHTTTLDSPAQEIRHILVKVGFGHILSGSEVSTMRADKPNMPSANRPA